MVEYEALAADQTNANMELNMLRVIADYEPTYL